MLATAVDVALSAEAGVLGEDAILNEDGESASDGEDGESDIAVSDFNDDLDGGGDKDDLAGDVRHAGGGSVILSAKAGSGGDGVDSSVGFGFGADGGDGGSDNTAAAFNDRLTAGDDDDIVVGDVRHAGSGSVGLSAEAGSGGRGLNDYYGDGGAGGSDNTAAAFNDRLTAGDDDDPVVGDVRHAGSGSVSLSAKAGSGGDGRSILTRKAAATAAATTRLPRSTIA